MSLFTELKRRKVFRVLFAYAVVAWLVLQIGDTLAPALRLPEWASSLVAFFLILGFPLAIFFAWAFEMTPDGLRLENDGDKKDPAAPSGSRKIEFLIIALLVVALAYFAFNEFAPVWPDHIDDSVTSDTRQSIAVLPFLNMSSDPDQEYFSDGLSEELLNLLAKIPELRVTSRSSAFSFKGRDFKVGDVGKELNVAHVLEGSVRKFGNKVRITAQLIDVNDDAHLWSDTWDRDLGDVFKIQDEIAQAVVEVLRIRLLGEVPHAKVTSPDAYALYLQAVDLIAQRSTTSLEQAAGVLQHVLEIDPDYAPAWTQLGAVNVTLGEFDYWPLEESFERAREFAQRAVGIDAKSPAAHALLGYIALSYDRDFTSAERNLGQALSYDANNADALVSAATLAMRRGNLGRAEQLLRDAISRDPFSATLYFRLGVAVGLRARRYDEGAAAFRKAIVLSPDAIAARYGLGQVLFLAGDFTNALVAFESESDEAFKLVGQALVHHKLGNATKSQAALAELIRTASDEAGAQIAQAYAVRGELDLAMEWLERAYANHDAGVNGAGTDPFLDNLRGDPRFEAFLDRTGLRQ